MRQIFGSLSKKFNQNKQKSPNKKSSMDPNQTKLNKIIATLFNWKQKPYDLDIAKTLDNFPQLLIWTEKHNPTLFSQIASTNIFQDLFISLFASNKLAVLQSLTLIITNIKTDSCVQKLICSSSVNIILQSQFNQEENTYLINLLKCISQRITVTNSYLLVNQNNRSFFLEKCAQYVDHQDDMIRASSLNIILNIMNLNSEILSNTFVSAHFIEFYFNICERFIRKLLQFNYQIVQETIAVSQMNRELAQLDDTLIFFEDLALCSYQNVKNMISSVFYHDVILSYLVQSISLKGHSQLSMKVGLFFLIKCFPLLSKMKIQDKVLQILFSIEPINQSCFYYCKLSKSDKLQFFYKIMNKQVFLKVQSISSLRQDILILLTCKDDNLLYLFTSLLLNIFNDKDFSIESLSKCGLNFNQKNEETLNTKKILSQILMNQFKPPFRAITIQNLAALILKICKNNQTNNVEISDSQISTLKQMFMNSINQVYNSLDGVSLKKALQYFQYDMKYIELKGFQIKKRIGIQSFMIPGQDNLHLQFYQRCSKSPEECVRLDIFIFGILRKIKNSINPTSKTQLFSEIYKYTISAQDHLKTGQLIKQQQNTSKCYILQNSSWVQCAILDDTDNLIIVINQSGVSKIVINIRFKFLSIEYESKGTNFKIILKTKSFHNKTNDFISSKDYIIKGESQIMNHVILTELSRRYKQSKEKQVQFIKNYLQNSIGQMSLENYI